MVLQGCFGGVLGLFDIGVGEGDRQAAAGGGLGDVLFEGVVALEGQRSSVFGAGQVNEGFGTGGGRVAAEGKPVAIVSHLAARHLVNDGPLAGHCVDAG